MPKKQAKKTKAKPKPKTKPKPKGKAKPKKKKALTKPKGKRVTKAENQKKLIKLIYEMTGLSGNDLIQALMSNKVEIKNNKRKIGRPSLMTEEKKTKALQLARFGLKPYSIAKRIGVDPSNFKKWLKKSENKEFAEKLDLNRTDLYMFLVGKILKGIEDDEADMNQLLKGLSVLFSDVMQEIAAPDEDDVEKEEQEFVVKIKKTVCKKRKAIVDLEDDGEEGMGAVRMTAQELGENISDEDKKNAEEAEFEEAEED